jgi:hypothetical protein
MVRDNVTFRITVDSAKSEAAFKRMEALVRKLGGSIEKVDGKTRQLGNSIQTTGNQSAAAAVNFQTATQGALNLTTAVVQTYTSISNLARANNRAKMSVIAVARAEDLLANKEERLNTLIKSGLGNSQKRVNIEKEIATATADLTVKTEKMGIEQDAVNDIYLLFATNIANVTISSLQTMTILVGRERVARVAATLATKLHSVATLNFTMSSKAATIAEANRALGTNVGTIATIRATFAAHGLAAGLKAITISFAPLLVATVAITAAMVIWDQDIGKVRTNINKLIGVEEDLEAQLKKDREAVEGVSDATEGLGSTLDRLPASYEQATKVLITFNAEMAKERDIAEQAAIATERAAESMEIFKKKRHLEDFEYWNKHFNDPTTVPGAAFAELQTVRGEDGKPALAEAAKIATSGRTPITQKITLEQLNSQLGFGDISLLTNTLKGSGFTTDQVSRALSIQGGQPGALSDVIDAKSLIDSLSSMSGRTPEEFLKNQIISNEVDIAIGKDKALAEAAKNRRISPFTTAFASALQNNSDFGKTIFQQIPPNFVNPNLNPFKLKSGLIPIDVKRLTQIALASLTSEELKKVKGDIINGVPINNDTAAKLNQAQKNANKFTGEAGETYNSVLSFLALKNDPILNRKLGIRQGSNGNIIIDNKFKNKLNRVLSSGSETRLTVLLETGTDIGNIADSVGFDDALRIGLLESNLSDLAFNSSGSSLRSAGLINGKTTAESFRTFLPDLSGTNFGFDGIGSLSSGGIRKQTGLPRQGFYIDQQGKVQIIDNTLNQITADVNSQMNNLIAHNAAPFIARAAVNDLRSALQGTGSRLGGANQGGTNFFGTGFFSSTGATAAYQVPQGSIKVPAWVAQQRAITLENTRRLRYGGIRQLGNDGKALALSIQGAVTGGSTSLQEFRIKAREEFRSAGITSRNFLSMFGTFFGTSNSPSVNSQQTSRAINMAQSYRASLAATGQSITYTGFRKTQAGGRYLQSASSWDAHRAAVAAANQRALARASQVSILQQFGLPEYFGGSDLGALQAAVAKQDDYIAFLGLNRTEAFKIIDASGRGREELDDRTLWTQRNNSISTGVAVI